ncbi:MAG: acyltransferase, partial [Ignavibacteriaceae bacterium]|nr:acyltransferase [Ignavibacteriaceae bacterium]
MSSDQTKFSVGLVQMALTNNQNENLNKAINKIEESAKMGAEVICLPELFRTQYFCQIEDTKNFDLAESIPGPSTNTISKIAKDKKVVVIVPLFEKRSAGVYHNTAAVIDSNGEILGTYRKMHIPDDPGYYEKFYFAPGDLGYKVFVTNYGKIGTLICWDQWYPEAARLTSLLGASIIFYPTA